MADLEERVSKLEDSLETVRLLTEAAAENTAAIREIVEAWNNAKGFLTVIRFVGNVIQTCGYIAAFGAAVWALIRYGHWPKN